MNNLSNKKILLIICGGIAAYKSLEIIRLLKKSNVIIKTILTKSGAEFVTPLSITSLSQSKVYQDLFNIENEAEMDHINLSRWADLILIAPATANTISKIANGNSDDLNDYLNKVEGNTCSYWSSKTIIFFEWHNDFHTN